MSGSDFSASSPVAFDDVLRASLTEYDALYRLAEFRMGSLDRRVPAAGALLTAFVGLIPIAPDASGLILLAVIPVSLLWFLRTTVNHARPLEDLLRRIEAIEASVNLRLGDTIIAFQASHPSRGSTVGGRTGRETVGAVATTSALLLGACLYLVVGDAGAHAHLAAGYALYVASISAYLLAILRAWQTYRAVH